jgi:hypothetical protein
MTHKPSRLSLPLEQLGKGTPPSKTVIHIYIISPMLEINSQFPNTQSKLNSITIFVVSAQPVSQKINQRMRKSDQKGSLYDLNSQEIVCFFVGCVVGIPHPYA